MADVNNFHGTGKVLITESRSSQWKK